jgi:hypothetical protein
METNADLEIGIHRQPKNIESYEPDGQSQTALDVTG